MFDRVALDHVALDEIVEAVDPNTAFETGFDLVDLFLVAAQRGCNAFVDEFLAPDDADLAAADAAALDETTGDRAALGKIEELTHLGLAGGDFLLNRRQQAGHGVLHLVDEFVDYRVELDLHAFALGDVGHTRVDPGVKAENDAIGGGG